MTADPRHRRFWWLNALAWLVYALLSVLLTHLFTGRTGAVSLIISGMLAISLFAWSGLLRHRALTTDWWQGSTLGLLGRLVLAVVAGATAAQLLLAVVLLSALGSGWVSMPNGRIAYTPASTAVYWINTAMVLALWTGLWAGLHSMRRARQSELARLRAEARHSALERDALRARLNPHFVFNALNNLRALILEDPERAREMVTRLSRTLRHALEHGGAGLVRLDEELAVVRDYLAIEAVHLEARLQVEEEVVQDAGDALLPAMALQVLVENAIKHGIAVSAAGGVLRIRAWREGSLLRVAVDNPLGQGQCSDGHGVGLAYLRSQLQVHAGRFALTPRDGRMHAVLEMPQ